MYNDPKDEVYVLRNIIKDNEEIEKLERKTEMESGKYCFVSNKKVEKYMVEKIKLGDEGLKLTEEEPDLSIINGTD